MVTFFSFLNDFLILMYNFLMFRTIFSIFSIISLIKVDVFIYIYVRLFILETMSKHRSALKCLVDMFRIVIYNE